MSVIANRKQGKNVSYCTKDIKKHCILSVLKILFNEFPVHSSDILHHHCNQFKMYIDLNSMLYELSKIYIINIHMCIVHERSIVPMKLTQSSFKNLLIQKFWQWNNLSPTQWLKWIKFAKILLILKTNHKKPYNSFPTIFICYFFNKLSFYNCNQGSNPKVFRILFQIIKLYNAEL